jgi:hypothetical protein
LFWEEKPVFPKKSPISWAVKGEKAFAVEKMEKNEKKVENEGKIILESSRNFQK